MLPAVSHFLTHSLCLFRYSFFSTSFCVFFSTCVLFVCIDFQFFPNSFAHTFVFVSSKQYCIVISIRSRIWPYSTLYWCAMTHITTFVFLLHWFYEKAARDVLLQSQVAEFWEEREEASKEIWDFWRCYEIWRPVFLFQIVLQRCFWPDLVCLSIEITIYLWTRSNDTWWAQAMLSCIMLMLFWKVLAIEVEGCTYCSVLPSHSHLLCAVAVHCVLFCCRCCRSRDLWLKHRKAAGEKHLEPSQQYLSKLVCQSPKDRLNLMLSI